MFKSGSQSERVLIERQKRKRGFFKWGRSVKNVAFDRSENRSDDTHSSHTTDMKHDITTTLNTDAIPLLKNYIPITIHKHKAHVLVDSGADISVANYDVLKKYNLEEIFTVYNSNSTSITTASQNKMKIHGVLKCKIVVQGKST